MNDFAQDRIPDPVEFADAVAHVLEWYWDEQREQLTAMIASGEPDYVDDHIFWSLLKLRCWLDGQNGAWQNSEGGKSDE